MEDIIWLTVSLWLGLLGLGYLTQRKESTLFSGLVGMLVGIEILSESLTVAFAVILFNVIVFIKEAGSK